MIKLSLHNCVFVISLLYSTCSLGNSKQINVYLFPGQGSDHRVFKHIVLPEKYSAHYIENHVPEAGASLREYALSMIPQVDLTSRYIFIGHSLGGMICSELADTLDPEMVIVISSAKTRDELPTRYSFQKIIPLNKMVPKHLMKWGAMFLQPIVEPDRNTEKETFKSMLSGKSPEYMKRTVDMIVNWDRIASRTDIIHIHGDADNTIPIENVSYDHLVKGGSHMMVLTRGEEINKIIISILAAKCT